MRKAISLLLLLLCFASPLLAQNSTDPDYQVAVANRSLSVDGSLLLLQFNIYNLGGAASVESTARLFVESDADRLIAEQPVRALGLEALLLTFEIPLDDLPGGNVDFRLEVGVGEVEAADAATIENNFARVGYLVPESTGPRPTRASTAVPSTPTEPTPPALTPTAEIPGEATATPAPTVVFDLANFDLATFDWNSLLQNPIIIPIIVLLCGVGLILLWVMTVILRLLFRAPKVFDAWTPPYAAYPPQDPNTLAGRRQLWQHNAQSDSLNVPCMEGQYHIRKQLVGLEGGNLAGWRVRGLRLSQYDVYGRVARSQTLVSDGLLRKLNGLIGRKKPIKPTDIERITRPIARQLVSGFVKKVNRRSLQLPIAIDLRFRGVHGEVRILFELYQCQNGMLKQVDHWEPEMTVVSGAIHENYTYTLLGQRQGETLRAFWQRLQVDIQTALKEMLVKAPAPVTGDTSPSQPVTIPETPPVPPAAPTQSLTPPPLSSPDAPTNVNLPPVE